MPSKETEVVNMNNYKKIILDTKEGKFADVIDVLKQCDKPPKSEMMCRVICCISSACTKNSERLSNEDLLELTQFCIADITTLEYSDKKLFLSSSYYILDYLLKKNEIEAICQLERMLLPSFTIEEPDLLKVYGTQWRILYKHVTSAKDTFANVDCKRRLFMILLQMINISKETRFFEIAKYLIHIAEDDVALQILNYTLKAQLRKTKNVDDVEILKLIFELESAMSPKMLVRPDFGVRVLSNMYTLLKTSSLSDLLQLVLNMRKTCELNAKYTSFSPTYLAKFFSEMTLFVKNYQRKYMPEFCSFLNKFLTQFAAKCTGEAQDMWDIVNCAVQKEFYTLLRALAKKVATINLKCKTCDVCGLQTDVQSSTVLLITGISMFKRYVKYSRDVPAELMEYMKTYFVKTNNMICSMREYCKQWRVLWQEANVSLYNCGVYLFKVREKLNLHWLYDYYIKQYLLVQHDLDAYEATTTGIHSSFNILIGDFLENRYTYCDEAFIALNVFFCKTKAPDCTCIQKWIYYKQCNRDKLEIKKKTLVTTLLEHEQSIKKICPNFSFSKSDKATLLLYEASAFKKTYPSTVILTACLEEIYEFGDPIQIATCIRYTCRDFNISHELYNIIYDTRQKLLSLERCIEVPTNIVLLANVYIAEYQVMTNKAEYDISKAKANMPESLSKRDEKDLIPNAEWDCMSMYESLQYDHHLKRNLCLLNVIQLYQKLISLKNPSELLEVDRICILSHLFFIVHEFQLNGEIEHCLKASCLYKKMSEIFNDVESVIKSIGFVLEHSDIHSEDFKKFLKESELNIETLENNTYESLSADDKAKVVVDLYVITAKAYLRYNKIEEGKRYYARALRKHESSGLKKMSVGLMGVAWHLYNMPCENGIESHNDDFEILVKPLILNDASLECSETLREAWSKSVKSSVQMMHRFKWTRVPRELRSSAKHTLLNNQDTVLPLQCANVLCYLVEADLMGEHLPDAQVKLNTIRYILNLPENGGSTNSTVEESLANALDVLCLSPSGVAVNEAVNGSPHLRDKVKLPAFLQHASECYCSLCSSVYYKKLILIYFLLEGKLQGLLKNTSAATECFKVALRIHTQLTSGEKYFEKMNRVIGENMFSSLDNYFTEVYAEILFEYGKILFGKPAFVVVSDKLLGILEDIKLTSPYFYNEACLQRLTHIIYLRDISHPASRSLSPDLLESEAQIMIKTPEANVSEVRIAPITSPTASMRKRRIPKTIKFELPDNEDESCKKTEQEKTSPIFAVPKTPHRTVPKIKIYTPKSVKPTRKKTSSTANLPKPETRTKTAAEIGDVDLKSEKKKLSLKIVTTSAEDEIKTFHSLPNIVVTPTEDEELNQINQCLSKIMLTEDEKSDQKNTFSGLAISKTSHGSVPKANRILSKFETKKPLSKDVILSTENDGRKPKTTRQKSSESCGVDLKPEKMKLPSKTAVTSAENETKKSRTIRQKSLVKQERAGEDKKIDTTNENGIDQNILTEIDNAESTKRRRVAKETSVESKETEINLKRTRLKNSKCNEIENDVPKKVIQGKDEKIVHAKLRSVRDMSQNSKSSGESSDLAKRQGTRSRK